MSEFRRDPITGAWVIIAPDRERRPHDGPARPTATAADASFDPDCPFCPGNEAMLPNIITELASSEPPGWRTRAAPNKYPALDHAFRSCEWEAPFETAPGRGRHEVIIESPRHDDDLARMNLDGVRSVLQTYRSRYEALMAEPAVRSVILFRNRGKSAGASLRHPHSQIIALERAPQLVEERERAMADYHSAKGGCALCDLLVAEGAVQSRIIEENDAFVTLTPFAASAPYEIWLAPKRHQSDFLEIREAEIDLLSVALQNALRRLSEAHGDPPYNYAIDSASKGRGGSPFLHWRLRIVPQSAALGGFELASGLPINPHLPENDAEILRSLGSKKRDDS